MSTIDLHPIIVHFPIALILTGFFIDVVYIFYKKCKCLPQTAFYLEVLGTIGAILAVFSGMFFTRNTAGPAQDIKFIHASFAIITTGILIIATLLRIRLQKKAGLCNGNIAVYQKDKGLKWMVFFLMMVASAGIILTGFYGGKIVYDIWLFGN